jgi:arginine deiminase
MVERQMHLSTALNRIDVDLIVLLEGHVGEVERLELTRLVIGPLLRVLTL